MSVSAGIFLGVALLGLFIFLGYHAWQTRGESRRIAGQADARGWNYKAGAPPVIYELSGEVEGAPFTVVSRRPAGMLGANRGNAPTVTALSMEAPHIEGIVIAEPAMPAGGGAALANALAGDLFRTILLGEDADAARSLRDVTASFGGTFPGTHAVSASDPLLAQRLLHAEVQRALSGLAGRFGARRPIVLVRRQTGVSVRVLDSLTSLEDVEAIALLAAAAARAR